MPPALQWLLAQGSIASIATISELVLLEDFHADQLVIVFCDETRQLTVGIIQCMRLLVLLST